MNILIIFAAMLAFEAAEAKIFSRCELAKKLSDTFPLVAEYYPVTLAAWNCIVLFESSYNSRTRGPKNRNGSYDYGIFQINDKYWCKVGSKGGDCNIDCNDLLDDDIKCAKKIFERHGFSAWYAWKNICQHASWASFDVSDCFFF